MNAEEKLLADYLREIRGNRLPAFESIPEELQWQEPFADQASTEGELLESGSCVKVDDCLRPVRFSAFLDGVQRTQVCDKIAAPSFGVRVPVHVAHIAAAVIVRDDRHLFFAPDLYEERKLLLWPLEGLRGAGAKLPEPPIPSVDSDLKCLTEHTVFWCDTTHVGLTEPQVGESSLVGEKLLDTARIRSRAQTRVGVWRQLLELLLLSRFVEKHPDLWILVDGPLYFDLRWHKKLKFDLNKAARAVGYIKSIRGRPKDLLAVLNLDSRTRSCARLWGKCETPKLGRYDEDSKADFPRPHVKWYIRQRVPARGWQPPDATGLAAVDIDLSVIGLQSGDDPSLKLGSFDKHAPIIDSITLGIWEERYPGPSYPMDFSYYVRLYPVEQLERALHGRLMPARMLANLGITGITRD